MTSPHLLLALSAFFWAGHWIVARATIGDMTPVSMSFWRWTTAVVVLAILFGREFARESPVVRAHWRPIAFFALTGTAMYNTIGYYGIRETTATNAVMIQSVTPALIPLLGLALFRERIGPRTALGVAVSFCGVLAIICRLEPARLAALQINPGDLFLLANVLLWSLYTICLRWKPPQLSQTSFLLAAALFGMLPMLPLYALDLAAGGQFELAWGPVLGVLYLGVFPSVLCYQMWGKGVAALGAARSGVYLHLTPLFGAAMAVVFLGERLQVYHVAGFALILTGITLTSRRSA
jgi:drug/metabolite transporter (DMT)-like permease